MLKIRSILAAVTLLTLALGTTTLALAAGKKRKASFTVRIENVSNADGLDTTGGAKYPFALSPGFYSATAGKVEFFKAGKKASLALEAQAEDGDPEMLSKSILGKGWAGSYGVFNKPVGADMPAPILPGGAYEVHFNAAEGMSLNLIAMYGQSNDLFYAPTMPIALFDADGNPLSGDITAEFLLWDAGTEVNEAPGIGADQAPRQKMKNTGTAENGIVALVKDGFVYPNVKDVLRITVTAN